MKTRLLSLFATLLLLGAGAMAQSVVLNYKNGDIIGVDVSLLENVTFEEADNHEFVDLELPSGTLWAMMNVGANTPEDYGDYFAWGETETKASFYYENYKWMNEGKSSWDQINKYTFEDNQTGGCWYSDGSFVGDGIMELTRSDDAATRNWGSKWQMPTPEQFEELINPSYTTTEFKTRNGVNGLMVTGKNGLSIFLPAAGSRLTGSSSVGTEGTYWSRSLSPKYSDYASFLWFNSSSKTIDDKTRVVGRTIRPVCAEKHEREYVEIGGLKWATMNVGATTVAGSYETCCGSYFAWGETEAKTSYYGWSKYKYCNGTDHTLTKYCTDSEYGYNGFTDNKTVLDPEDDAATANWGYEWCMPTREDFLALYKACAGEWDSNYEYHFSSLSGRVTSRGIYWLSETQTYEPDYTGVAGLLFVCKDDIKKRLFFPSTGDYYYYNGTSFSKPGTSVIYWTSTLHRNCTRAYYLNSDTSVFNTSLGGTRSYGHTVRAVRKE